MNSIYYVYELINPDTNTTFYVGKGKDDRMYFHERSVRNHRNSAIKRSNPHLYYTLLNLISSGKSPIYRKVLENLSEADAFDLEKNLILGYRDQKIPLCNLTDGGEGQAGHKRPHTAEERKKISARMSGVPKTAQHKEALRQAKLRSPVRYWVDKSFSNEHRAKLSNARKAFLQTEEGRAQLRKSVETQREQKRKTVLIDDKQYRGTWSELKDQTGLSKYRLLKKIELGEARWVE